MENQPTIDERLQFLLQSTESLHASCQELHASITQQNEAIREKAEQDDKRWNRLNKAIRAAVLAYFEAGNGDAA